VYTRASLAKLESIKSILEYYKNKGTRITLRHLYYKLVSKRIIVGKKGQYDSIRKLMTTAREEHYFPIDCLIDSSRVPVIRSQYENIQNYGNAVVSSYTRDRWESQDTYVEVWIEKASMTGILKDITRKYCVPLVIGNGYNSLPAVIEGVNRISSYGKDDNVIIYLGDLDPSGIDMDREIRQRFIKHFHIEPDMQRIALTIEQTQEFNLAPQLEIKKTDPRYPKYKALYGDDSWELEALDIDIVMRVPLFL